MTLNDAVDHRERFGNWPADTVVITFDDGYANVVTHAQPVLARHGFVATMFVISGHVGKVNDWAPRPRRLPECAIATWDQLRGLESAGWEIAAHTHSHPDLRRLSAEEIEKEIDLCNDAIASNIGRAPRTFAYPFGSFSRSATAAAARHYRAAVTTTLRRAGREPVESLPRIDMFYAQSADFPAETVRGRRDGYLLLRRFGRWLKLWLS